MLHTDARIKNAEHAEEADFTMASVKAEWCLLLWMTSLGVSGVCIHEYFQKCNLENFYIFKIWTTKIYIQKT